MIVADTNLIASLLISGPLTTAAEAVWNKDSEWTAPALWRYEFRNLLATQMRVLGMPMDQAIAHYEKAEQLMLDPEFEIPTGAILRISDTMKLTAYDAEFVALARALKVKLVTADGGILKASRDVAISLEAFAA